MVVVRNPTEVGKLAGVGGFGRIRERPGVWHAGRVSVTWCKGLVLDAIPSGASQHAPSIWIYAS